MALSPVLPVAGVRQTPITSKFAEHGAIARKVGDRGSVPICRLPIESIIDEVMSGAGLFTANGNPFDGASGMDESRVCTVAMPAAVRVDILYTLLHRLGLFRVLLFFSIDPLWDTLIGKLHVAGLPTFSVDGLWPGVTDVAVKYTPGRPELKVSIDRDRAAQSGLPVSQLVELRELLGARIELAAGRRHRHRSGEDSQAGCGRR